MSRESANDGEVKKRSFSSSGAQALEDFNQEVEDFKHLNILKSPYTDGKTGEDLLLSVREEAATIISRIGLSTSDGKGERPNDRRRLTDWYRSIYYAAALLKLLRHLDPSAPSNLRNSEVIQRLIDIKAGFPSRTKWLHIYQDVLGDAKIGNGKVDKNVKVLPPPSTNDQGNGNGNGNNINDRRRGRSRSRSRVSFSRGRSLSRSRSPGDPSKADLHSGSEGKVGSEGKHQRTHLEDKEVIVKNVNMVDVMVKMSTNICDEAIVTMVDVKDAEVVPDEINGYPGATLILGIKPE